MTLTYIFHSGFVLETEQSILVFDYWLDPSGVMGGVLKNGAVHPGIRLLAGSKRRDGRCTKEEQAPIRILQPLP